MHHDYQLIQNWGFWVCGGEAATHPNNPFLNKFFSPEPALIRITILDSHQTVSFPGDEDSLLCLVGGCSANPASLEELLIASDVYKQGIAATLMSDLMDFDKTLQREGADTIHKAIMQAQEQGAALDMTFQVFDEPTRQEAMQARGCELVIIDINSQTIKIPASLNVHPSGEIHIRSGGSIAGPTVTYILPQDWSIQPEDGSQ